MVTLRNLSLTIRHPGGARVATVFQVVIDKVLVHRGLTTLEVRVIGLLVVNLADATGLRLRVGRHAAHQQPP
jgi:ABC-type bacteriocin/lantibiotic exporter with double-glycine peptidase domain